MESCTIVTKIVLNKSKYSSSNKPPFALMTALHTLGMQNSAKTFFVYVKHQINSTTTKPFIKKAITYREINLEKSPLSKLVLGLCSQTQTDPTEPQDNTTIRPKQIMRKQKDNYLTHWKESTKKHSKLKCYLALNIEFIAAEYLTTVTDPNSVSIAFLLR